MEELQRILATEEVKPNQGGGSRTKLTRFHAGKSGRVAQLGSVAEDRRCAEEGERRRGQASEAKPDGAKRPARRSAADGARARRSGWFLPVRPRRASRR